MDRIERAEATLAAASARHPDSCLPGGATSPADRLGTVTLPHDLIAAWDRAAHADAQERELAHGSISQLSSAEPATSIERTA